MTAVPTLRTNFFSWFKPKAKRPEPVIDHERDDLRREYVARIIASEGCTGEYGAQALMGLFPKDF